MALLGRHAKRSALLSIPTPDVSFASATGLPAVYLRGGCKTVEGKKVLDDVLLTISRGEIVSVVGPSASELDTLMRCLALLEPFDAGVLAYGALQVTSKTDDGGISYDKQAAHDARARLGVVFGDLNLFPHFTVLRNVSDVLVVAHRRTKDEAESRARKLLSRFGLAEFVDKYPAELSAWQQFCVAVCRALAVDPKLVYFGDVSQTLGTALLEDAFALMRELAADGLGVGVFTGRVNQAAKASDRLVLLMDGCVADTGTPTEVLRDPQDPRAQAYLASEERRALRNTLDSRMFL